MIEFDNRQDKIGFNKDIKNLIEISIQNVLKYENFNKEYEISVVICDNDEIRQINKEFRGIDKETDVLSFPMLEYDEGYSEDGEVDVEIEDINPETGEVVLGDIVLSLEKAEEQAREYGHTIEREVAFLTVHSVLHLLGYDHEKEEDRVVMREREEDILSSMHLAR